MFVPVGDITCVRQGDILDGVPFPRLSSAEPCILGRLPRVVSQTSVPQLATHTGTHREDSQWLVAQIPVRLSYCAVMSQCCELEPRNGQIGIPAFALARLISIPKKIIDDAQRLASLKSNKDPRDGSDPGYVNLFYIPARPELSEKEWVVDFNQTVSIPGK